MVAVELEAEVRYRATGEVPSRTGSIDPSPSSSIHLAPQPLQTIFHPPGSVVSANARPLPKCGVFVELASWILAQLGTQSQL